MQHLKRADQWIVASHQVDSLLSYLAGQQVFARVNPQAFHAVAWVKPAARQQKQVNAAAGRWLDRQQAAFHFEDEQLALWLFQPALTSLELTELHQLLLPTQVQLNVVVAGTGNVGAEFLALLAKQQQAFAGQIELKLAGVLNSRQALFAEKNRYSQLATGAGFGSCLYRSSVGAGTAAVT